MAEQSVLAIVLGDPPADATERATDIVQRARPLFAGQHPTVVSAALADLLAIWVAGHLVALPDQAHAEQIGLLLPMHIDLVRELIKPNIDEMRARTPEVAP